MQGHNAVGRSTAKLLAPSVRHLRARGPWDVRTGRLDWADIPTDVEPACTVQRVTILEPIPPHGNTAVGPYCGE